MNKFQYFDFEADLQSIHTEIETLEQDTTVSEAEKTDKIAKLEKAYAKRLSEIYSHLSDWQVTQIARHPARPYTLDYIHAIFTDFVELHGDREFADDASIVAGLAHLGKHSVAIIGHQKGRDTKERAKRNFGMAKPEGFRKAQRIMKLAEKFGLPLITFIDTPGAYPGMDAEERNQSEAIGRSIYELSQLKVPTISVVIGEGGSGGALALAVTDVVLILQYAIYSVISPEGCASILWKDASKAPLAAETLSLTAPKLIGLGLVDKIISEPLGGAHRDAKLMALTLKKALLDQLLTLITFPTEDLLARRAKRLSLFGQFRVDADKKATKEIAPSESNVTIDSKETNEPELVESKPLIPDKAVAKPALEDAKEPLTEEETPLPKKRKASTTPKEETKKAAKSPKKSPAKKTTKSKEKTTKPSKGKKKEAKPRGTTKSSKS